MFEIIIGYTNLGRRQIERRLGSIVLPFSSPLMPIWLGTQQKIMSLLSEFKETHFWMQFLKIVLIMCCLCVCVSDNTDSYTILRWCQKVLNTDQYRNVHIVDFTSSWRSGLAFCALIHAFRPALMQVLYTCFCYTFIMLGISRSSQCSTTGVTNAVVCVILSVGWCI